MLSDYETQVEKFVSDDANRLDLVNDFDRAIALAVQRYGKDRPQTKVEDVTPTDANTLPLPNAWEAEFSSIQSLEHPIGDVPPTLLESGRWQLYRTPTAQVIQVVDALDTTKDVRVSFSIAHVLDATHDTIPVVDREAVAAWAAAILCEELAAFYSGGTDSTIQADSVRQQSKAQEYAARAKALRKRYLDEIGVEEKTAQPAGAIVAATPTDSRGEPRITHSSVYRNTRRWG